MFIGFTGFSSWRSPSDSIIVSLPSQTRSNHLRPELFLSFTMPIKCLQLRRLTLALYAVAASSLAFTVFLWGVTYKCSLYAPPSQPLHSVPVARLLSERERPGTATTPQLAQTPLAVAAFPLWLLAVTRFCLRLAGLRPQPLSLQPTCDGLRFCSLAHFLFRPPPVLLS